MSTTNNHINYIEFRAKDLENTKLFYTSVFNWKFTDNEPKYVSFENSGITGGFEKTEDKIENGVLVVVYHSDLKAVKEKVIEAGGRISKDIFSFPGGQRFEFKDPSGNKLAVWSE